MDFGTLLRATNGGITLTRVGAKLPDLCDGKKPCRQEGGADNAWEALQVDSGPCRSLVWDPGGFNSCSLKAGKTILTSSGLKPGSLCPVAPRGNLQNVARNLHLASKCFSSSLGLTLGTFPRLLEQDNAPTALACPTEPSFVPAPQAPHAGCSSEPSLLPQPLLPQHWHLDSSPALAISTKVEFRNNSTENQ